MTGGRRWALALLMAGLIVVGFRPSLLVNALKPVLLKSLPANVGTTTMLPPGGKPVAVAIVATPRG